ncbi:hypothetical protein H5410_055876 [Solanum commersonii]|uniref:At2g35280-like TPR domain-containing protein n=1 Tax=Solanum commersonii TaxID=4109 RepID=A0A9J5WLJ3_SOLCO|nr:hypothetical protein H5410_055876 [Solanum commersonii]
MTYCEEIHPVPPEDSWIVPLDVIEREIPPPYVDQSKPGRRRYKRWRGVGESFPTRKNNSRVFNQVANEPFVYQKVTLVNFPYCRWSIVQEAISFLEMCRALGNLEALYRKGVIIFYVFHGGHISASYVLAIISIFNGGESMREGLMFIANMTPLKLRRCREKLRYTLYGWVLEPHLLGERPICCTVQSLHFHYELCRYNLEIDEVVKFLY